MTVRMLVDGVAFQSTRSGRSRLWASVLPHLAERPELDLVLLDRGGAARLGRATCVPFARHKDAYTADDSLLLQKVCDHYRADVFVSTGFTSPVSTPMLLLVSTEPRLAAAEEPAGRALKEERIAVGFARRFLATSEAAKRALRHAYPDIPEEDVSVAQTDGVESADVSSSHMARDGTEALAAHLASEAVVLAAAARSGAYRAFFREWARLRAIQADVDTDPLPS